MIKNIVIIGGGFAGVWSAVAAMRHCSILGKQTEVKITLISKDAYHGIRPRYYEVDLSQTRISLIDILNPIDITFLEGEVFQIDVEKQCVLYNNSSNTHGNILYDKLVLASGSTLYTPPVPGLSQYSFNVDTYEAAIKLKNHLKMLPESKEIGANTFVVVGGGFTGLEVATELVHHLKQITTQVKNQATFRIIMLDHNEIGSTLGVNPQSLIHQALKDLHIETIINDEIKIIEKNKILLSSEKTIDTQTVIWTAGMRANHLTGLFPITKDKLGRLTVDPFLHIKGIKNCFAVGDVANAMVDDQHTSMMCCQHAIPQGRFAGYNVIAELFNQTLIPYRQERYVTHLDMGPWGAIEMQGWERKVILQGEEAKKIKMYVNQKLIYPPLTGNIHDLFDAAAPRIQSIS